MKSKNLTLLFIFGLFILISPSSAEASCGMSCTFVIPGDPQTPQECSWMKAGACACERLGLVGNVGEIDTDYCTSNFTFCCGTECNYNSRKCKCNAFPSGDNGELCVAKDGKFYFPATCNYSECDRSGVWDASDSDSGDGPACIQCSGKIESKWLGDSDEIYDNPCETPPAGDGDCESACGANTACDEVSDGGQCNVGDYCQSLGRDCQTGDMCSGCVCVSGAEPAISFSPSSFTFTAVLGGSDPADQTLEIWNSGDSGSTLSWSVSDNRTWLSLSPTSGNSTGEHDSVTVSVSISGLTANTYTGTITISDPDATNNPRTVPVTLTITAPNLQISDIEDLVINGGVDYTIYNEGDASTESGFYCSLYINGSYEEYEYTSSALGAGLSRNDSFSWDCTPGQTYSIEVCADDRNGTKQITESDEYDNCRTENLTCPEEVCTRDDPYVSISPSSQSGGPGEELSYSVTIINYDTVACGNSTFDLDITSCPSGWSCSLSSYSRTISPDGSSGSVSLHVTSAAGAIAGTYTIQVKATNSGATSYYDYDSTNYVIGCDCTGWTNQSCGYSTCDSYHMGRTRTCTPSGCLPELECFCDESCCSSWADQGCGLSGCIATEMYQTRTCGSDCSYLESRCVSDPACGGVVEVTLPIVTTVAANNITETSATLNATLNGMGGADSCLVWFEWGLTPALGNKTPEQTRTIGPFWEDISGLTPDTTYYYQAFARNGGSW